MSSGFSLKQFLSYLFDPDPEVIVSFFSHHDAFSCSCPFLSIVKVGMLKRVDRNRMIARYFKN